MAGYSVRSLKELSQAARKYFTQSLDGAVVSVWPNTFTVTAKVLALIGQGMELRRRWLVKQLFASTADRDWLIRHGFELNLQPGAAETATGTATGAAPAGTVVPADLSYTRPDGAVFTVIAPATARGAAVSLVLVAATPGTLGNTDAGTSLTLVDPTDAPVGAPLTLVVDAASDGSGLSGGADAQDTESFRAQVLYRKRNPPQGGSAPDYVAWVYAAVPTALAVFVDSFQNDARSVWVQFTVSDQPNGIPSAGQVAAAQAYVSDPVRRPITARVFVTAPEPVAVPVVISRLAPDTPDVRAAIDAEIAAVYLDRAQPGSPTAPFVLSASWIDEAISRATGEDSHVLVSPATDLSFPAGQMPTKGATSYQ